MNDCCVFLAFGGCSVTADTIGARTRESSAGKRHE